MSRLFAFRSGDPIPRIEYNEAELSTWKAVFDKVEDLLPGRACLTHRKYLDLMKKECSFSPDNIPQLEDLSNFLKSKTIPSPKAQILIDSNFIQFVLTQF